MVVVALDRKGHVSVAGMGLPLEEDYEAFCEEARADVMAAVAKLRGGGHKAGGRKGGGGGRY